MERQRRAGHVAAGAALARAHAAARPGLELVETARAFKRGGIDFGTGDVLAAVDDGIGRDARDGATFLQRLPRRAG